MPSVRGRRFPVRSRRAPPRSLQPSVRSGSPVPRMRIRPAPGTRSLPLMRPSACALVSASAAETVTIRTTLFTSRSNSLASATCSAALLTIRATSRSMVRRRSDGRNSSAETNSMTPIMRPLATTGKAIPLCTLDRFVRGDRRESPWSAISAANTRS